ncbi:GNAT family N-acetyltransferase [Plantactinospora sp. GCM10030261]|uniref:GNAT family N-acetyltransferase n=1 Tax=Plantactinospora sp. GCM10030261 TaxID=3273420 RepID=UPI003616D98C
MSDISVRTMAASELDAAGRLIGLAFRDNPGVLAVTRGDRDRADRTMRAVARVVKLGNRLGHVLVAELNGELVGVLNAVEWPRCQPTPGEKLRGGPALLQTVGSALPRLLRLSDARARHDPRRPHWHVGPVAVHPDRQGLGVGTALLRAFVELADRSDIPAFLETDVDRNVALYQRFGFEVTVRREILGVDTRFMWRDRRPGSGT